MAFLLLIIGIVFNVFVAIMVSFSRRDNTVRALWFVAFGLILWAVSNYLADTAESGATFWSRLAFLGPIIVMLASYFFVTQLRGLRRSKAFELLSVLGSASVACILLFTPAIVEGTIPRTANGQIVGHDPIYGVLYWLCIAWILLLVSAFVKSLFKSISSDTHRRKNQLRIIRKGAVIAIFIPIVTNLILPVFLQTSITAQLVPLTSVVYMGALSIAIFRYGLFDIRLAASRTLAYVFTLLALGGLYSLLVGGLYRWLFEKDVAPGQFGVNIIVTLVLVFVFQPIKRFFDRITNSIFYRDRYNKDEFYARVSDVLTSTTELRRLMQKISHLIGATLRAEQASFFVYRSQTKYTSAGTDGHAKVSIQDARLLDELILTAGLQDSGPIVAERLASEGVEQKLYRFMVSYKLGVILPLMQAGEMIGYVFMGRHRAGSYAARDILVLTTIADELVIAIQNVLSVQEVRELNETLQQRIDDATKELRTSNAQLRRLDEAKDEFVSMASHQLRTPLTSVKGYIDMMLEGDAGEITPMQRQFLTEAFLSSDRMVHLINDFLNVSRLQTGKFVIDKRPVDLAKLVSQEIEGLRISAEGRELSFEYTAPTNLPKLLLDEGKIRQVVMNFADNALYYSKPNTKIIVSLRLEKDSVVCTVKDTGIGVPEEEQERLFTKFYRASNAKKQRPDGTGVGLFLAKRVIVAHGGSVIFSSVEGKGSTFGFRLPLKTLRAVSDADKLDNK